MSACVSPRAGRRAQAPRPRGDAGDAAGTRDPIQSGHTRAASPTLASSRTVRCPFGSCGDTDWTDWLRGTATVRNLY